MTSASGLPTVACIVITKNEEANIQDCLKSAQWANELIAVDAESRDKTVELARACEATVFVRPWPGFGLQKNFGMGQASSDWILILDADERVTEDLRGGVRTRIERWKPGAGLAVAFRKSSG
jgi:(heptosyl)LPS beta-1,4-glucosyltransferase